MYTIYLIKDSCKMLYIKREKDIWSGWFCQCNLWSSKTIEIFHGEQKALSFATLSIRDIKLEIPGKVILT